MEEIKADPRVPGKMALTHALCVYPSIHPFINMHKVIISVHKIHKVQETENIQYKKIIIKTVIKAVQIQHTMNE